MPYHYYCPLHTWPKTSFKSVCCSVVLCLKNLFVFELPGILTAPYGSAHVFESEYETITHFCIIYLCGVALAFVFIGT